MIMWIIGQIIAIRIIQIVGEILIEKKVHFSIGRCVKTKKGLF